MPVKELAYFAADNILLIRMLKTYTRMWANAQRDGRPAEWRPLFNAAKFG